MYIFVYPQILRTEFQFGCKVLLFFLLIFYFMLQPCVIDQCGELQPGEDDIFCGIDDGTGDMLPEWPGESELDFDNVKKTFKLVCSI